MAQGITISGVSYTKMVVIVRNINPATTNKRNNSDRITVIVCQAYFGKRSVTNEGTTPSTEKNMKAKPGQRFAPAHVCRSIDHEYGTCAEAYRQCSDHCNVQ